jgi:hypothetical protein
MLKDKFENKITKKKNSKEKKTTKRMRIKINKLKE